MSKPCRMINEPATSHRQPSRLYHFPPIGIGTPLIESLSSHITRLAAAHLLPMSVLVMNEMSPFLSNSYFNPGKTTLTSYKAAGAMNGRGKTASEWVAALEKLTSRNDLSLTTLLPFTNIFPDKGLLKADRAWCPLCFEQWRENCQDVYDPLLWKVQEVAVCAIHKTELVTTCPSCHRKLSHVACRLIPGHCPRCGAWLGHNDVSRTREANEGQLWVAESIGNILARTADLTSPIGKEKITSFFDYLIENRTRGSARALARLVGINHSYIIDWRNGKYMPTLGALLHICRFFRESLEQVVFQDISVKNDPIVPQDDSMPTHTIRVKQQGEIDWERIKNELICTGSYNLKISDIAKKHQCSPSALYRKLPELCRNYTALRFQSQNNIRNEQKEEIKQQIRSIVGSLVTNRERIEKSAIYRLIGGKSSVKVRLIEEVLNEIENSRS